MQPDPAPSAVTAELSRALTPELGLPLLLAIGLARDALLAARNLGPDVERAAEDAMGVLIENLLAAGYQTLIELLSVWLLENPSASLSLVDPRRRIA